MGGGDVSHPCSVRWCLLAPFPLSPSQTGSLPVLTSFPGSVQSLVEILASPVQDTSNPSTAPPWLGVTLMAPSAQPSPPAWLLIQPQTHLPAKVEASAPGSRCSSSKLFAWEPITLGQGQSKQPEEGPNLRSGCRWLHRASCVSRLHPEQGMGDISSSKHRMSGAFQPRGWGQAAVLWHRDLWHGHI